ncbi:Small RNA 2'-O-methyltransferase [Eufriesea mexicana]|uniref:Small RNA 2'-O-methyltransferase n=1 Tax=Eufriesea mexicana TaxID=516756 RepID=A0A310SU41_9HYME|nr:Small RNA 2'-O-methyltransferase [Eufriesea mexicana]
MIIVLFHVLYLFGKFVYQNYRSNKQKAISDDTINTTTQFNISEKDYLMRDPEAPQDLDKKPIKFFPPAYVQRYVAVSDILSDTKYQGKLRKVVDFGCAELEFLVYLKNTTGVEEILCVDINRSLLEAHKDKAEPLTCEYLHTRTTPLVIEICEGSVTQNDRKLENTDAVICIELIEHLYPDVLIDFTYNIFGYIKPKLVIITTPNADFNVLFPNFSGFRHYDHKFEWTRQQFQDWAENITSSYPDYIVTFEGIGKGPEGTEHLGCITQMAIFNRIGEKQICRIGIENLFKTVVKHEYPFRIDNRSDEEKIIDQATFYIRQLSFQDLEEEIPLKLLLDMLKSFYISENRLQIILEEAGWVIENRESGMVVLVPPVSSYSDQSSVEYVSWDDDYFEDEDDQSREPGPPINSKFLEENSLDTWDNDNWDGEPSIVIPQNNSVLKDNTYLFDEENVLLSTELETIKNTEIFEGQVEISSKVNLDPIPSTDNFDAFEDNVPSCLNESIELCNPCLTTGLENMKENSFLYTTSNMQDDAVSSIAKNLNHSLNIPPYMSVSRASTSPDPYLLHAVKLDQHLENDSMSNQNMSNHWMLNNSLKPENISVSSTTDVNIDQCKKTKYNFNDCNYLHNIYLHTSYKEDEDSDIEHLGNNTNTSINYLNQDQVQSVQQNNIKLKVNSQLLDHLQSSNSVFFTSSAVVENPPLFTSSPKIENKVNSIGKKRRSLDYKEQKHNNNSSDIIQKSQVTMSNSSNLLNSNAAELLQSNNDIKISTTTVNSSAVEKYHKQDISMSKDDININIENELVNNSNQDTLSSDDTVTITSTLNSDKEVIEELPETNSLSINYNIKKDEILQVDVPAVDKISQSNSLIAEKFSEEQKEFSAINTNNIQSVYYDTKIHLSNQQLMIKSGSNAKTELISELHNSCDLGSIKDVNNIEMSCNHPKDISNLESIPQISSFNIEGTKNIDSTSVLNSEKQLERDRENYKSKCKNINSNIVEVVENIELKSSPETVETPPSSWSPEVMDSGYPNTASTQDITPEYDLSSIAQDHISDSESPSIAEAPRLEILEIIEVENGDLANNNRDGEGNNMMAAELNDLQDLQPFIHVLENDIENENDIYALENGFPLWLLRILNMANPVDVEIHMPDHRELSSEENSDLENNEMRDNVNDANENGLINNVENNNENAFNSDGGSEQWVAGNT